MTLFDISDIRQFWSTDKRFYEKFFDGKIKKFKPISKYQSIKRDISFWTNQNFYENDFLDIIRDECKDYIENVKLVNLLILIKLLLKLYVYYLDHVPIT